MCVPVGYILNIQLAETLELSFFFVFRVDFLVSDEWTNPETTLLLYLYKMHEKKLAKDFHDFYKLLSTNLANYNYSRTPDECRHRMNKLRDDYKDCVDNNQNKTGRPPKHCAFEAVSKKVCKNIITSYLTSEFVQSNNCHKKICK